MDKTIETIEQYNRMFGVETKHPLVTVVEVKDYAPAADELIQTVKYGLYAIFLKQGVGCRLRYGRKEYDYQAGSIVAMAPGQVVTTEFIEGEHSSWKALLFHPDLLFGTPLAERIREYGFFGYDQHEALHVSDDERRTIEDTFQHIANELGHAIDKHSSQLLTVYVQLVLDYCLRFYDRQFITRHKVNSSLISRFERVVDDYLSSDRLLLKGQPLRRSRAQGTGQHRQGLYHWKNHRQGQTGAARNGYIHHHYQRAARIQQCEPFQPLV